MYDRPYLIAKIDVWLGMIDDMLIVRCMLVCVCVCELDANIEYALNRVKTLDTRCEANLRVGRFWVPNTFPRPYVNSNPKSLVVRSKGPSSRGRYIYGS